MHKLTPRNYFKWMVHNFIVKTALNCSADCPSYVHWCQKASPSKHFLVILRNLRPCCLIVPLDTTTFRKEIKQILSSPLSSAEIGPLMKTLADLTIPTS